MSADWRQLELQASQFKVHGELAKAIECYDKAISITLESDPVHAGLMLNSVADLHLKLSQFALAETCARRSIAIEIEFGNTEKETLATYYIMLARTLERQNRYSEALESAEKALAIYERVQGSACDYLNIIRNYHADLKANSWRG